MKKDRALIQRWLRRNPQQEQELLRELSLIYGALIVIGVYMVQPFLTAPSLDLSAKICVVAFSVAIPLLAGLVILNRQEAFRHRPAVSRLISMIQVIAEMGAFVGVVAAFWHILWIAGAGVLAGVFMALVVHSAGYRRLEQGQNSTPEKGDEPGDKDEYIVTDSALKGQRAG